MNSRAKFQATASLMKSSAIIVALGFSGGMAFAAATANDTASNYAPSSWSTSPPNYGTGFGAWNVQVVNNDGPPYAGTYLDSGSPVVSGGYSWGTYANSAQPSTIPSIQFTRPFQTGASGSSSLYNQTFSVDLSSQGVGPNQGELAIGVGTAFNFFYDGTGSVDNFQLSVDGAAPVTSTVNFTDLSSGIAVSLQVNGALNSPSESYTLNVNTLGNVNLYSTSGTFDSSAFNASAFSYLDSNTTGNGYFNNLNITPEAAPEPSSLALMAISGLSTLVMFRRRK